MSKRSTVTPEQKMQIGRLAKEGYSSGAIAEHVGISKGKAAHWRKVALEGSFVKNKRPKGSGM